jgi:isopentenyldiphosphate isomerase
MTAGDELVEVVDEAGTVLRLATRAEMRAGNLRHRAVAVVVLTTAGELVAHRRADWKDVWPGRWDVCFGGVAAVGEDWATAARRELAEEAGVEVPASALRSLGSDSYQDESVSWFGPIFAVTHDGPFRPADGEGWLAGRELTADSAAMVVPRLLALARGIPREPPGDARG